MDKYTTLHVTLISGFYIVFETDAITSVFLGLEQQQHRKAVYAYWALTFVRERCQIRCVHPQ